MNFRTGRRQKLRIYWLLFLVVFAIHNAEEAIFGMPEWLANYGFFLVTTEYESIAIIINYSLLLILTIAAAVVAYLLEKRQSQQSALYLEIFAYIMLINAFSHIGLSLYTDSIMPGLVTSVVLLLPICGYIIVWIRKMKWSLLSK